MLQLPFAFADCLLGYDTIGDILNRTDAANNRAIFVIIGNHPFLNVTNLAVGSNDTVFVRIATLRAPLRNENPLHLLAVIRVHAGQKCFVAGGKAILVLAEYSVALIRPMHRAGLGDKLPVAHIGDTLSLGKTRLAGEQGIFRPFALGNIDRCADATLPPGLISGIRKVSPAVNVSDFPVGANNAV